MILLDYIEPQRAQRAQREEGEEDTINHPFTSREKRRRKIL